MEIFLPKTYQDDLKDLEKKREELSKFFEDAKNNLFDTLKRSFEVAGGCTVCYGRGWIVAWDTLDFIDGTAAEFGICTNPDCTDESRASSGLHPRYNKYDRARGAADPFLSSELYKIIIEPIADRLNTLKSDIREIDRFRKNFEKGDKVVVARGRKVPIGTAGRVSWISYSTGNVLVKEEDKWQDRHAEGVWVNPRNLEKIKE